MLVTRSRWCILICPSFDVSSCERLGSEDDSRAQALEGGGVAEQTFLAYCVGSKDILTFMLVLLAFRRKGWKLSSSWDEATEVLQQFRSFEPTGDVWTKYC